MGAVSLRLPEDLERKLSQEASLSGQPRSQLIREALEALLSRRERERLEAALVAAARVLASDPAACAEALATAADFLPAENEATERAETDAVSGGADAVDGPWWR
ncbi:ribbon-helix-helix protein, CopG family [Synechococcus sp. 1G10]|uniref:ribbon-helix-helix protein, CopG family n=1 Tax=Synechococcus sp. 1G10 TaxID=2025605 RepID=UPI000B9813F8|nr:ribbon-helix-helix protein, CopG family [Synechococcus sp. 1G10]